MTDFRHKLTDAPLLCELLDRPVPVQISTVSPRARPQASLVWVERRDDILAFFFEETSVKVRNLRRNAHVTVLAVDYTRELRPGVHGFAQLAGTAQILPEEPDMPDRLATAYGLQDGYNYHPRNPFNTVLVTIDRITGTGPIEGGGLGGWAPA